MKMLFTLIIVCGTLFLGSATDPIKKGSFFVEADLSYSFYYYYNQALFKKQGLGLGGAIILGHQKSPLSIEYSYRSPVRFIYRNNEVKDQFSEIGLRYNLNHLTYLIPYGLDPYVGVGIMRRNNAFTQFSVANSTEILSSFQSTVNTYKFSAGVKVGSRKLRFGLHYDYLPRGFDVPKPEGNPLRIYNAAHIFSLRVGLRLNTTRNNRVRCPKFNSRTKRTINF